MSLLDELKAIHEENLKVAEETCPSCLLAVVEEFAKLHVAYGPTNLLNFTENALLDSVIKAVEAGHLIPHKDDIGQFYFKLAEGAPTCGL